MINNGEQYNGMWAVSYIGHPSVQLVVEHHSDNLFWFITL
jgi:hypothetical protein